MAEKSKIEWCDATYNAWIGCTKVSPGCLNCYAANSTRARVLRASGQETWGKGAERSRTKTAGDPRKWDRAAASGSFQQVQMRDGTIHRGTIAEIRNLELLTDDIVAAGPARPRVFCSSLSDWLDDEVPVEWLADLLQLIHETPNLDWLLLTKRPENFDSRIEAAFEHTHGEGWQSLWLQGDAPDNVWIGTTVEDQTRADERIPLLLDIPARVRFLSCEPLLGPVSLALDWEQGGIHWVIAGGESGPGARPMNPDWARSLRDQCQAAGVPFLFKQHGEFVRDSDITHGKEAPSVIVPYGDGDPTNFRRVYRVGKKAAGRTLDGRTWDQFPDGREGA